MREWNFTNSEVVRQPGLKLAKHVIAKHPNEFIGAVVYGYRRIGKSIYVLKVMQQIFMSFGCTEGEAWELALQSLYFEIPDILERIHELAQREEVWPALALDDAGVGAGSMKWFSDRKTVQALNAVFDTMGTITTGFFLTTPTFERILRFLRDAEDFYRISITSEVGWDRRASAYLIKLLPSGTKRIMAKSNPKGGFVDEFSAYLPNKKYHQYKKKRLPYTIKTSAEALRMVSEPKKFMRFPTTKDELKDVYDKLGEALKDLDVLK